MKNGFFLFFRIKLGLNFLIFLLFLLIAIEIFHYKPFTIFIFF